MEIKRLKTRGEIMIERAESQFWAYEKALGIDFDNAIREAADVALYAAFIADPVRVLKKNA